MNETPARSFKRPGGEIANRPLHFIWICDRSGSMSGDKIQALNFAIASAIPMMQAEARANPQARVYVRALAFSRGAEWVVPQPTPVEEFRWDPLRAEGETDMGQALTMVAAQMKSPPMPEHRLAPVLVLISDGHPTDRDDGFGRGLAALMAEPAGAKAVRIAIAIGKDADHAKLQKFIGNPEIKPLHASNSAELVSFIRWASTIPLRAASQPKTVVEAVLAREAPVVTRREAIYSEPADNAAETW